MMRFFLDASALAKRYVPEPGSELVDFLMDAASANRMICLMLGAGEVISVLVRRKNSGHISAQTLAEGKDEVLREVMHSDEFAALPLSNEDVEAALPFLETHSLNMTDAALLHVALEQRRGLCVIGDDLVLVASDARLLRAAEAEGLEVFNPESGSEQELADIVGTP